MSKNINPKTKLTTTLIQSPSLTDPSPAVVLPAEQALQTSELPFEAEYVPIGQISQFVAPGPFEDVPGGHKVQTVLPKVLEYVVSGHMVQFAVKPYPLCLYPK